MYVGGEDVRFRIPLLKFLNQHGFNMSVAGSENGSIFKVHGIEYHTYQLGRGLQPFADMRSIFDLMRIFRKHKVDIVHAFDTKPGLLVPVAAIFSGIPIIVKTIAGMGYVFSSHDVLALILKPAYHLLQRLMSKITDMTVFQNKDDADYFIRHKMVQKDRQQIILSSGIDLSAFDRKRIDHYKIAALKSELGIEHQVVIILVSRLVRNKGIKEYLEAARQVRYKYQDTIFLLVGPYESEGKQAIPSSLIKQYSKDVLYLGRRDDVYELLAISDIFVLPSYYREGVPRVLLEASAMGMPIITTDMPGCREVVKNGWNGMLVPICNVKVLTESLEWLINHKEQRHLMGERGKDYTEENFNLDKVARAHIELYRKLLVKKIGKNNVYK
jgi:glycosyltransferase involved in cell wall biosynthesis